MERSYTQAQVTLRNILVPTDFSSASRVALFYALSLVRRYSATLYLAHIVGANPLHQGESQAPGSAVDQAWREGHRLTTDLLVSGHLRDIPHKLLVAQGSIWETLAPMIQEHEIDLIVLGTRGRTGLSKMFLGSTAEVIFRQASCPVVTVGPNFPGEPIENSGLRRILAAATFKPHSLHAVSYALSFAQQYQAHLTLLHVVQESYGESRLQKARFLDEAKMRLRKLVSEGAALQFEPDFIVGFGTPAARILDVAAEQNPDLIVLGVRQSPTMGGRRPWRTASEVTSKAACPVLTVREPEQPD
ncbi:MAG TPA: universal stress protein [Terriglobales bacterium]|nr:universal stress protein [Terriglobales bacterium]